MHHFAKKLLAIAFLIVPALSFAQVRNADPVLQPGQGLTADADSILARRTKSQDKKGETLDVYMYAAAFSMIDSVLVISDIQKLEQVRVNNKWFLTDRREYEKQFGEYVTDKFGMTVLPFINFSPKEKTVLKQRERLVKKSRKKEQFRVSYSGSDFKFSEPVRYRIP